MPIDRSRYPDNWKDISRSIRVDRAGNRCECTGHCGDAHFEGRCNAPNWSTIRRSNRNPAIWHDPDTIKPENWSNYHLVFVILTTAHLDHDTHNNDHNNLLAMCQRCHLNHDRDHNVKKAAITRRLKLTSAGQLDIDL